MKSGTPKCEQRPRSGRTSPPAPLSHPLWADTRGAGADREQGEPSMGIPDGNKLGSSLTPSTVRATRTCPGHGGSPIIARPGGRSVPPAMCEVPRGAHKPLRLHVLWGMTNKGLQSFEKAEFLDDYPNQISESFEDGLSPLRGSILRGTGRSCNRLTSF